MRLTVTGLSSQYIHLPLAPFCLKKAVEECLPSVTVTLCDLNVNDTIESLLRHVMDTKPDVFALCLYIWNRETGRLLIRRLKALNPDITVMVGGPEATFAVAETFTDMPCDFLLRGAGEESLPRLLDSLDRHLPFNDIPGVCYREGEGFHMADIAPSPAPRSDLYDEEWQRMLNGRMAYVETSRGCPFSCAFCLSGQREKVQFMPQEEALSLLIRLGQSGASIVKLIDRTFNCDKARTAFLLSGLIQAKAEGRIGETCYHLEVAADLFDEPLLTILEHAPAGLFQLEAGLQSFHGATLDASDRHTDMDKLVHNLRRILSGNNIHTHIDLIAGLPEEDFETFGRSFDQAYALHPHQLQLGFLKLIHGSRLRASDWGQRFSPDPPYEVLSTPWLTYVELCRLHACADAVERLLNSGRFTETLALALTETKLRPFHLFLYLGEAMAEGTGRWSLDNLTKLVYDRLTALHIDAETLRDAMVIDRLTTDNTGYIPPFLQRDNALLKQAIRQYRAAHPEDRHPHCALIKNSTLLIVQARGHLTPFLPTLSDV